MLAPTLAAARRLEVQAALAKAVACFCMASVDAVNRLQSLPLSSCLVARSVLCDANFIVRWGKGRWGTNSLFGATLPPWPVRMQVACMSTAYKPRRQLRAPLGTSENRWHCP